MTRPNPDITLTVNLRNPGQFFACCGLLELASRLWPACRDNGWRSPEGWFEDQQFLLAINATSVDRPIGRFLRWLCGDEIDPARLVGDSEFDDKVYPVIFRFNQTLIIDWWLEWPWSGDPSDFKFWAAHQHPLQIFAELKSAIFERMACQPMPDFSALMTITAAMTTRFGLDPVAAWTPIDLGFSPNEHPSLKRTLTSPVVELFAAFGLQGFRPKPHPIERRAYSYTAWPNPLEASIARAAVSNEVGAGGKSFRFKIEPRGRFKAFSYAQKI